MNPERCVIFGVLSRISVGNNVRASSHRSAGECAPWSYMSLLESRPHLNCKATAESAAVASQAVSCSRAAVLCALLKTCCALLKTWRGESCHHVQRVLCRRLYGQQGNVPPSAKEWAAAKDAARNRAVWQQVASSLVDLMQGPTRLGAAATSALHMAPLGAWMDAGMSEERLDLLLQGIAHWHAHALGPAQQYAMQMRCLTAIELGAATRAAEGAPTPFAARKTVVLKEALAGMLGTARFLGGMEPQAPLSEAALSMCELACLWSELFRVNRLQPHSCLYDDRLTHVNFAWSNWVQKLLSAVLTADSHIRLAACNSSAGSGGEGSAEEAPIWGDHH